MCPISKRYLQPHGHCSIISNSQHTEATQAFISGEMDVDSVMYPYLHLFHRVSIHACVLRL